MSWDLLWCLAEVTAARFRKTRRVLLQFTPAAGRFAQTALYIEGVALLTRESRSRGELLKNLSEAAGENYSMSVAVLALSRSCLSSHALTPL
nr:hypothetical protein [uncultured Sphingorhabdus sp.]